MQPLRRSENLQRANTLRKDATPTERRLWNALRSLRQRGFHFRRQAPFRGYVLDFVCYSHRLVIELDGTVHADPGQALHDAERDAVLAREGFQRLRFWNGEVHDLNAVMERVLRALSGASPP